MINKIFWFLINLFFGGFTALVMIIWAGCDMEMPLFFFPILPNSYLKSIFNVPWINFNLNFGIKILFNGCLFALFGFVHTFFAQEKIQQYFLLNLSIPRSGLRTFYLVLTNLAAWLVMGLWQHTSIQLWNFISNDFNRHRISLIIFSLINIPGGCVVMQFDILQFFGLKQIFQLNHSRTIGMQKLQTKGIFRLCRHPMYLFLLISLILSPSVSFDKILFTLYAIIYLYIAIPIEERKLEKIFDQDYIYYKNSVPAVIPNIF